MKRYLLLIPALALVGLTACDNNGSYKDGFRDGQEPIVYGRYAKALAALNDAYTAGWLCETDVWDSIDALNISCELPEDDDD